LSANTSFSGLWHRNDNEYQLPAPADPEGPALCSYALQFSQWTAALLDEVKANLSVLSIAQAKVRLIDKYVGEWRTFAPKKHRAYTGDNHVCLFHTFVITYEVLRGLELQLSPPAVVLPPPPPPLPPAPIVRLSGLFLGEEDE
jgi:hypothetical protein